MSNAPPPFVCGFDQVVKGDINIKQLSKKKYNIKFNKISNFFKYQEWSDSSKTLNDNRTVYYQKAKTWINNFNSFNRLNKASKKPLYRPTTVMEIGNHKYLFVIDEAEVNGKGHVVFKVSTKEIKLSEKKMLKLPCGHHDGVRFDIDSSTFELLSDTLFFFGSCPILIGADTIDLNQVNLFIFNLYSIDDLFSQSLSLFLNPASYWKGLDPYYFNINNPNSYDGTNGYGAPNSDWLPNLSGSSCQSFWYNCVGPDQNYIAYQIQFFAMFYAYISSVLQSNPPQNVKIPVYSTNLATYYLGINLTQNPTIVAYLTFNTSYPLQLNTLLVELILSQSDPNQPIYQTFPIGYSTPTNSEAFPYGSELSFDNIGFGPNILVPPAALFQAFPIGLTNSVQINYTSNSDLVTVTQSSQPSISGLAQNFAQVVTLSFYQYNFANYNNISTRNSFPPAGGNQIVTIVANQEDPRRDPSVNLTIMPPI